MSDSTLALGAPAHHTSDSLEDRLNQHPELRARVEELLKIVENADGMLERADDAEQRVIDELSGVGREALRGWARGQERKKATELSQLNPAAQKDRKKSSSGIRE